MGKSKNSDHNSTIYEIQMLPPQFRISSQATKKLKLYYDNVAKNICLDDATSEPASKMESVSVSSSKSNDYDEENTLHPGYAFISYSSKDASKAERVCRFLEKNKVECWMAPRNVNPGGNYPTQIVEAIRKCSVLVLLASENTNASGHVSNEVSLAFDSKKTILPFRIEDVQFTDEYIYFLRRKHWIDAYADFDISLLSSFST